jgi:hypothetical protein
MRSVYVSCYVSLASKTLFLRAFLHAEGAIQGTAFWLDTLKRAIHDLYPDERVDKLTLAKSAVEVGVELLDGRTRQPQNIKPIRTVIWHSQRMRAHLYQRDLLGVALQRRLNLCLYDGLRLLYALCLLRPRVVGVSLLGDCCRGPLTTRQTLVFLLHFNI